MQLNNPDDGGILNWQIVRVHMIGNLRLRHLHHPPPRRQNLRRPITPPSSDSSSLYNTLFGPADPSSRRPLHPYLSPL